MTYFKTEPIQVDMWQVGILAYILYTGVAVVTHYVVGSLDITLSATPTP